MPVDVSTYPKFGGGQSGVDLGSIVQKGLGIEHSALVNEHSRLQIAQQQRQYEQQRALAPLIQSAVRKDGTMDYQKLVVSMASHPVTAEMVPQFIEQAGKNKLLDAQITHSQLASQQIRSQAMAKFFASALVDHVQPDPQTGKVNVHITPEQMMAHLASPSAAEAGITPSQATNFAKNFAQRYAQDPAAAGMDVMRAGLHALTDSQTVEIAMGKNTTTKVPGAIMSMYTPPLSKGGPPVVTGNIPVPERDPAIEAKIQQMVEAGKNPDGTYGPQHVPEDKYRQFSQGVATGMLRPGENKDTGMPEMQDLSTFQTRGQQAPQGGMAPPSPGPAPLGAPPAMPGSDPNAPPMPGLMPGQAPPGAQTGGMPSGLVTPAALGPPGNLYSDAALGTGLLPAVQAGLRGTVPQATEGLEMLGNVMPGIAGPAKAAAGAIQRLTGSGEAGSMAVQRRAALEQAETDLLRAFSVNQGQRITDHEQQRLRAAYGVSPSVWQSTASLRDRMREINERGRRDLAEQNSIAASGSVSLAMRQEARKKAQALGSFLNKLNVPTSVVNPNAPELSDDQIRAMIRAQRSGGRQ